MNNPRSTVAVALIVFLANAGLLVLQLLASRWLVPFIGSSLETWTVIIGVFLLGIALGNAVGGRLADRYPSPRMLAVFLLLGAVAALSMLGIPRLLAETDVAASLPLSVRVPVLAFAECFPSGFVLSLITPLAIKLGLRDLSRTGRTAGTIFALGTLGCLAGNYITGFLLIPQFSISTITLLTAGLFVVAAIIAFAIPPIQHAPIEAPVSPTPTAPPPSITKAATIVFACSFCGMALELTATRMLAQVVGVSLFTWTGVIGVMLAGTAAGNALGGWLADRGDGVRTLALSLLLAALCVFAVLPIFFAMVGWPWLRALPLMTQIVALTFLLFFLPMMLLGTISPQVIKRTLTATADTGRIAGRIYAWSTAGAIAGTFATGYLLISHIGMYRTVLLAVLIIALATAWLHTVWQRRWVTYSVAGLIGLTVAGLFHFDPARNGITLETNYFTIRVKESPGQSGVLELGLDKLTHSFVKLNDPTHLEYFHEVIQLEMLGELQSRHGRPANVLVIGGGGYTFPRAAKTLCGPTLGMDVVEIDPGVTAVSYSHLGLDPALGIRSFHMDGRQFVAERTKPGTYDLITLDAVNDLSVPYHLLTREFNDAVKKILTPDGVYLVTVIDSPQQGLLWKSTIHTLRKTFPHVEALSYRSNWNQMETSVQMLYASERPLDLAAIQAHTRTRTAKPLAIDRATPEQVTAILSSDRAIILTDEYAPVDHFMSVNFRNRK